MCALGVKQVAAEQLCAVVLEAWPTPARLTRSEFGGGD